MPATTAFGPVGDEWYTNTTGAINWDVSTKSER